MSEYDLYVIGLPKGKGDPDGMRYYPGELEASADYKEFKREWADRHKPKEHEYLDLSMVWCPILDKVRPVILCEREHGADMDTEDLSEFDG